MYFFSFLKLWLLIYFLFTYHWLVIRTVGPQSQTLQPVRGEGYKPAYKSKANAKTHPRLGREVVVFQEGGEKLYTKRVSFSKNDLLLVL